ncbi:methionyl-tRNA formyltransferase [Rhodospirillaceae bacterium SYSU D60015]|uniref:methionyl-tRNA formyltransferase n=1 Tax=Desertibaculum subflavum TaxID=2268458 RepID=UPI000E6641E2
MTLVFMGTPPFAVPTLAALVAAGHRVSAVYTQPPRPAGRGHKEQRSAVHEKALALGLEVRCPASLKGEAEHGEFAALKPDAAVVVAYGLILPKPVLAAPRLGCFNLHGSILPRWRGAAPIERAILAGDAETGVAVMRMEAGLDTGPVLLEARLPIGPRDTAAGLRERLAAIGAGLMVEALAQLAEGRAVERAQAAEGITYAKKIEKGEGAIDWRRPAAEIDRMVRVLSPFPGVTFDHAGQRLKVHAAELAEGRGEPGTVLDEQGTVACGDGAIRLVELQRPGARALPIADFLRGFPLPKGTKLG